MINKLDNQKIISYESTSHKLYENFIHCTDEIKMVLNSQFENISRLQIERLDQQINDNQCMNNEVLVQKINMEDVSNNKNRSKRWNIN